MSSQKAICVRFPNGHVEFTFTAATPRLGDRVTRGDDEWTVIAIGNDENGNRTVTLGPPVERMATLGERPKASHTREAKAIRADEVADGADQPEDERRQVGSRIAQARRASGLSQRKLAALLRVTTRTIQNYESGASSPHRHLHEINVVTRTTSAWILHGDEAGSSPVSEHLVTLKALREDLAERREVMAHLMETVMERTRLLSDQLSQGLSDGSAATD